MSHSPQRVLVVGGGLSALAACCAAHEAGAVVTVVSGRVGASVFASGAYHLLDVSNAVDQNHACLPEKVHPNKIFADELQQAAEHVRRLGLPWLVGAAQVVTSVGVVRLCLARDPQILDLQQIAAGRRLLIPRVPMVGFDADALAQSLLEQQPFRRGAVQAVEAELLQNLVEIRLPAAELAALHDNPTRRGWLAARLRALLAREGDCDLLLPPMLGADTATFRALKAEVGVELGETTSDLGGASSARMMAALSHGFAAFDMRPGWVQQINVSTRQVNTVAGEQIDFDTVVVATGGISAGGFRYQTAEHDLVQEIPGKAMLAIQPTCFFVVPDDDIVPYLGEKSMSASSSLFGLDGDQLLLGRAPILDRVGFGVDETGSIRGIRGHAVGRLYAAGDCVANAPRNALDAIAAGFRAGVAASRVVTNP